MKTKLNIKKISLLLVVIILFGFVNVFAGENNNGYPTTTQYPTPSQTPPTDPKEGDELPTEEETRAEEEVREKLNDCIDINDEILAEEAANKIGEELADAKKDPEEVEPTEKTLAAKVGTNLKKSATKFVSIFSTKAGDPVNVAQGDYVQNEVDLILSPINNEKVMRSYSSSNDVETSIGFGWNTNLDERIIMGVDGGVQEMIDVLTRYISELKARISYLEDLYRKKYAVTNIYNGKAELKRKVETTGLNIEKTVVLLKRAEDLNTVSGCYIVNKDVLKFREKLNDQKTNLEAKFKQLKSKYSQIDSDIAKLNTLKSKLSAAQTKLNSYQTKQQKIQRIKARNAKAMFPGMTGIYEETGFNTLTIVDGNGIPHLMYETSTGSGVWKNADDLSYLECRQNGNGVTAVMSDGTQKEYDSCGFIVKITDRNGNFVNFIRNSDEQIEYIESSSGARVNLEYQNGKIVKISNARDAEQCVIYSYDGNKLISVCDTDGDTVTMTYNSNGLMTSLNKCDGNNVIFNYGARNASGNYLATATTNEEGFSEMFEYSPDGKRTIYTDHDGNKTEYEYDERQRTIHQVNSDGTEIFNTYTGNNLTKVVENGLATNFEYDLRGNKTKAVYADGSRECWNYDAFNQIISYTDRDGVIEEFVRDDRGNLTAYKVGGQVVFTQEVDSRGLVIRKTEYADRSVITTYEYDESGNVTAEVCGGIRTAYEYDAQNRVKKIFKSGKLQSEYSYTQKKTTRTDYNGLETCWEKNGRKDLVKLTQKDNVTGKVIFKRIVYDGRHLPVQVYVGHNDSDGNEREILQTSYTYTPEGKIKKQISYGPDDKNFVREYFYKFGQIETVKQYIATDENNVFVQKYEYSKLGQNRQKLTVTDGNGIKNFFEYDSYGNLVKITDGNGESSGLNYSKAGRLTREQGGHGGWFEYNYSSNGQLICAGEEDGIMSSAVYNPNGSVSSETDLYGKIVQYSYNNAGQVSSVISENSTTWYSYDNLGRVNKVVTGNSQNEQNCKYLVTYEYSQDGRHITVCEGGKYTSSVELDAFGNVICQTDGNGNTQRYEYDSQNRVTAFYDGYGNKTIYEYGANGEVTKVTAPDGNPVVYDYNYMGKLSRVTDAEGVVYSAVYDAGGRLIKERSRADAEKSYEYDNAGRVTKVICGNEVIESYVYSERGRQVTVKDGNGSNYLYTYDAFGRLTSEKNRLGDTKLYFYDAAGEVQNQKSLDGGTSVIEYSQNRLTKKIRYADGTETVFEYDSLGNIVRAQNAYGITEYKYDLGGQLIWQKDVTTGEEVWFEYDAAKNRTKLKSTNRETVYKYGKNNEVLEVYDNKQRLGVSLKYDVCGREVQRKFANGIIQTSSYDRAGRIVLVTQKGISGEVTWAEGYVYGNDGKRTATVDNFGHVTLYEYNAKGELSTVYYPYTKEMEEKLTAEAVENGLPVNAVAGVNKFLQAELYNQLGAVMNKMNRTWAGKISNVQLFIAETYIYDKNGNRVQKKTPFGTINYSYDLENRLISSGSNGKTIVNYTYDKNGNLLSKDAPLKSEKYSYNSQNRLCESVVIDHEEKTQSVSYYAYDAFGRRVLVQDRDAACLRTLYDGFSFDVIKQSPTLQNGLFVDSNETGLRINRTGKATGERYRYLGDVTKDDNRYFYLGDGTYKSASSRYTGERTSININGTIAAQNAGGEVSYFTTDQLGSVRNTTDNSGFATNTYSYDAFGSLVEGNLTGATDYGYSGKQFDPSTGLYNYGYRDYAPKVARFTTVDPICDGSNWFAYCNNDAVNHVDLWGLESGDAKTFSLDPDQNKDITAMVDAVIFAHSEDKYITDAKNEWRCDNYAEAIVKQAGANVDKIFAGPATEKTVQEHIDNAVNNNGVTKYSKSEAPVLVNGAYVVLMNESNIISKKSGKNLEPHAGIIIINNSKVSYSDNSSNNNNGKGGAQTTEYNSVQAFQNDYGYQSFYYQKIQK